MLMSVVNRRLVQRHALGSLLKAALAVSAIAVVVLAAGVRLHIGGVALIVVSIFLFSQ
jgi:DHA1 family bicyclomycin/chloramphenicol resistance-like MFS transporter